MKVLAIKTNKMDPVDAAIIKQEKNESGPYIIPKTNLLLFLRLIFYFTYFFFYLMYYFNLMAFSILCNVFFIN